MLGSTKIVSSSLLVATAALVGCRTAAPTPEELRRAELSVQERLTQIAAEREKYPEMRPEMRLRAVDGDQELGQLSNSLRFQQMSPELLDILYPVRETLNPSLSLKLDFTAPDIINERVTLADAGEQEGPGKRSTPVSTDSQASVAQHKRELPKVPLNELIASNNKLVSSGELTKAEELLTAADLDYPDNHTVLNNRGTIRVSQGKLQEGLADLERAYKLSRNGVTALNVGIVAEKLGDFSKAVQYYRLALEAGVKEPGLNERVLQLTRR